MDAGVRCPPVSRFMSQGALYCSGIDLETPIDKQPDAENRCVECAGVVPAAARLCAHCGSHQSRWRNELLFVSTLVGIASVTVTAIAFLISIWPKVTAVVAWQDRIEVIEFDETGTIVVANRGDGPVYISDFQTNTPGRANTRAASILIAPGELGILEADSIEAAQRSGFKAALHVPPRDSVGAPGDPQACYTTFVLSQSSPLYRLWSSFMGDNFVAFEEPAEVIVRYHGIDSGLSHEDTLWVPAIPGVAPDCDIARELPDMELPRSRLP